MNKRTLLNGLLYSNGNGGGGSNSNQRSQS